MWNDFYEQMGGAVGHEDSTSRIPEILTRLDRNEELIRTLARFISQGSTFEGSQSMAQLRPDKDRKGRKSKREKKLAKKVKKLKKQKKQLAKQAESNHRNSEMPWWQKSLGECASKAFGIALDEIALRQKARYTLSSKEGSQNVMDLSSTDYKIV